MVSVKNRRLSSLFCFQRSTCHNMGCSTSSRATVKEPSSNNPHQSREVKKQAENDPLTGRVNTSSQGGSVAEDYSSEGRLPDSGTGKLPPANEQNTDIHRGGLSKKPVSLTERERQTSSDILEELRMQGIIKTTSANSNNRAADDATTREEQLKKELLTDRPSPLTSHESRTTGSDIDCSASEAEKTSNTFQLLSLNLGSGSWIEKEDWDDNVNGNFEGFSIVESDVTYNMVNEAF
ncbi:stathmin domain-containing protein 1 isoform X1 [Podarcis raffonei]|uniref:stathmin domain-containing protein 1 isoform X1 n=1 Tax=Podarcis raffonei TaxID=65483 RepID=UPI0023295F51|nr:stathmin domain-containing protein 1 isoform X1 [Podarcis raffonei]